MLVPNQLPQIIGYGAYTVPDAQRLVAVPAARVHRWLQGRTRRYHNENVIDAPLWESKLPLIDGVLHLSFRDLIELRMVDRFRQQKISMPYLRKVVSAAQKLVGDSHPFSTSRFKTDGRKLYLEIISSTAEPELIEVLSGQHAFHSIISEGLKDIHFEDGVAAFWMPESGKGEVVIDPRRSFGQPVLTRSGVPTSTIKLLEQSGRSVRAISVDFEIDEKSVKAALGFENKLAA